MGDPGEDGRLKGEERGELKDLIGEAMFDVAQAWSSILNVLLQAKWYFLKLGELR